MSSLSPRERLLRVLNSQPVDRPPVICTGGMMNAAIVQIMNQTGNTLPAAHHQGELMAALAGDISDHTGFENLGIPFCMTVEAEVLGSDINYGTLSCEPKIEFEAFSSASSVKFREIKAMLASGRIPEVLQAARHLSGNHLDLPVIGNLTGPISTAASLIEPGTFLKSLHKEKSSAHRVVDYVSDLLIALAGRMIDHGVTLISIGDPTATGEILGPRMFKEFALPYLNKIADRIHGFGAPVIVHICGRLRAVKSFIPELHANAISTDALVNLKHLKEEFPGLKVMGNVSTYMLEQGDTRKIAAYTRGLIRDGIDI
ncbi:MAG: methylcobamide--CoM methyltransferase, partial [Deltaproteobacteria bacterium]|nr:methylcobamide--CoM methyltransferase [Deltaproteobacteria bacterium]